MERFHLLVVLGFVVAEDASNSGSWLPQAAVLGDCARVLGWEVVIDIIKHAVLGKFNDIRPGGGVGSRGSRFVMGCGGGLWGRWVAGVGA